MVFGVCLSYHTSIYKPYTLYFTSPELLHQFQPNLPYPWVKVISNCSNEGSHPFQRGQLKNCEIMVASLKILLMNHRAKKEKKNLCENFLAEYKVKIVQIMSPGDRVGQRQLISFTWGYICIGGLLNISRNTGPWKIIFTCTYPQIMQIQDCSNHNLVGRVELQYGIEVLYWNIWSKTSQTFFLRVTG